MATTSVTSKGQVTIPKKVREVLGIRAGSKVTFEVDGAGARIRAVRGGVESRAEDGPGILKYRGPRIPTEALDGGAAMKKAAARARR